MSRSSKPSFGRMAWTLLGDDLRKPTLIYHEPRDATDIGSKERPAEAFDGIILP